MEIALVAEGKNEEAISHYKMAIKLNPDYANAHNNLGNALVAEGKNEEAISHYKMAIKLNPDSPKHINNLGNALLRGRMRKRFLITRWLLSSSLTSPIYNQDGLEVLKMTGEAIDLITKKQWNTA